MRSTCRTASLLLLFLHSGISATPGAASAQTSASTRDELSRRVEHIAAEARIDPSVLEPRSEAAISDPARAHHDAARDSAAATAARDSALAPASPFETAPFPAAPPTPEAASISGAASTPFPLDSLPRYGDALFGGPSSTFAPPQFGPIGPDYRLGPGDEIVIDVWGDVVFRHDETLDRSGSVLLPDAGQVNLQGLTLAAARERLRNRLAGSLSGLAKDPPTTFLDVSLARLRPIKVFVVGEARRPGAYDLSAASTVLHALHAAGGPNELGSLRDVRVVRGERVVASLDVARYLRHGVRDGDIRLEDDDTIFVPVHGPRVAARGEITRPALYEMKPGETLADLVSMAGGLTARTNRERAHVVRVLLPEERGGRTDDEIVVDVDLTPALSGEPAFPLRDRDDVAFLPIVGERRNYVVLSGDVWKPGTYELREGMRAADLLTAAGGPRPDAFLDRAILVRTRQDQTRATIPFDPERSLAGDPSQNFPLAERDEITLFSIWDLRDKASVSIHGAVRKPGRYEMTEGMTLGDLLLGAGGFQEYAHTADVEVSRVDPGDADTSRIAQSFRVEVGADFPRGGALPGFLLQNHDQVFVRVQPLWQLQHNVVVEGEVRFPGSYTLLRPDERLADVIARSGGLLSTAYVEGFQLERAADSVGTVSVDLRRALEKRGSADDLTLLEGDVLRVPKRPTTVRVSGAVGLPTSLVYREGAGIGHYIDDAGGYLDTAKRGQVTVVSSTGRAAKVRRFWFDPKPEPGSVIHVPAKTPEEGIDWGGTIKDVTAILASLATTYLVIDRLAE